MGAVFVFDTSGDLNVFASLGDAAGWMEAIDVDDGEYAAAYLADGTVLRLSTDSNRVVLTPVPERDLPGLTAAVGQYERRLHGQAEVDDLVRYANAWLRREWEAAWPRRPQWLARRLHGAEPKQVTS